MLPENRRRIVIVVDEHVETRAILHHALTAAGHIVEQAPDGLTGLKMACRIHPALIIMEHPAYVYGGRALIESIRANVELEDVSIMILSSRGPGNDQWLENHPCDAYLSKPFQIDELLNIVSVLTDPEGPGAESLDPQSAAARYPRRRPLQPPRPKGPATENSPASPTPADVPDLRDP